MFRQVRRLAHRCVLLHIKDHHRCLCGVICFTSAAKLSLHSVRGSLRLSEQRRVTRLARSIKSASRKSARPLPMTTSGSGEARSVHCGGMVQIVPSPARSRSLLPDRLYRSPMQGSRWPANGWNGWVMRTSCAEAVGRSAFRAELQAAGEGPLCLAADQGRLGDAHPGTDVDAARRYRLAYAAKKLGSKGRWVMARGPRSR